MAEIYNVSIEDSSGNVYCPETDLLSTMEEVEANTKAGHGVDALVVKELNNNLMFPDGVGFYPDTQNGVRGYNTDAARGADTFHPFKQKLTYQYGVVSCGTDKNVTVPVAKTPLMVFADVGNYNSSFNGNAGEKVNGRFCGAWFRDFYAENKPLWMQYGKYSAPIVSVGDSTVILRNNMTNNTTVTYIFVFD